MGFFTGGITRTEMAAAVRRAWTQSPDAVLIALEQSAYEAGVFDDPADAEYLAANGFGPDAIIYSYFGGHDGIADKWQDYAWRAAVEAWVNEYGADAGAGDYLAGLFTVTGPLGLPMIAWVAVGVAVLFVVLSQMGGSGDASG